MSSLDAFRKAAKTTVTKKKSDKIELNDVKYNSAIEQWINAEAAEKQAEQDRAEAESECLSDVEVARIDVCSGFVLKQIHAVATLNNRVGLACDPKCLTESASFRVAYLTDEGLFNFHNAEVLGGVAGGIARDHRSRQMPVGKLRLVTHSLWKLFIQIIQNRPQTIRVANGSIPKLDGSMNDTSKRQRFGL